MKKSLSLLTLALFMLVACKKKDKAKETEVPEPTPVEKTFSLNVDGVEKSCNSACYSASTSGGNRGAYFYINGFDEYIYFSCEALPAPGTYTLVKYKNPYLMYSKSNSNRPASSGVITITAIDTSAKGVINNLRATFSFKTDTSNGVSYSITNGVFNLKN